MTRLLVIVLMLTATSHAAGITMSQLDGVDSAGKCLVRPTVGARIYSAIVGARSAGNGLSDAQVLQHGATRLGFGVSPHGPLTPNKANDCTTVFVADELANQIASLGATADTAQLLRIRKGVMPLTMYPRADLNKTIWRHQQDAQGVALGSYSLLWYEARTQHAALKTVREVYGSQRVSSTGVVTDRQLALEQVLLELWLNHFNVNTEKANQYFYGSNAYPEVVRAVQGTTFAKLLTTVMREPAMLYYLDNKDNRCDPITHAASNQNLARELLELHTLGRRPTEGVYAQSDVVAVAEALCGWNVIPYTTALPASASGFVFNASLASTRSVSVMGASYAAQGEARVVKLLEALAAHASTRTNICTKLSARLYSPSLVASARSACTAAWGAGGEIKPMVTALVTRQAFWQKSNYRTLQRTPFELVVGFARQLGASVADLSSTTAAENLTETPFAPAALTPQQALDRITALRGEGPFKLVAALLWRMRLLLGTSRGLVAPPTGYAMDGAAYLSSAQIDQVSRLGLEVATALTNLPDEHRSDVIAKPARDALAAKLASGSSDAAAEWFLETKMALGNVIGGGSAAPVVFAPSHASIVKAVFASSASWAFWSESPQHKQAAHTLVGLGLGNSDAMWR